MKMESKFKSRNILFGFLILMISLSLSFFVHNKIKVEASTNYNVNFDYDIERIEPYISFSSEIISSIQDYTISVADGNRIPTSSIKTPSKLINPYYSYIWTLNGNEVDITKVTINSNVTFKIKWIPVEYSVNFKFTSDELKSKVTNLQEKLTFTVESPRIELYQPEIEHYNFIGWYNGSVHYDLLYIPAGSIGSKTFTARFELKEYLIKYNTDATNLDNPRTYNIEDGEIILAEPSKEGHIFKGWYTDENYTTKVTSIDCSLGKNISIYPMWELEVYTVTFIMPNGVSKKVQVEYGDKVKLPDIDKGLFDIIITEGSRKNITADTTIKIKVVNIWYVYLLGILLIVGIILTILFIKRRRKETHSSLRNRYMSNSSNGTSNRVMYSKKSTRRKW